MSAGTPRPARRPPLKANDWLRRLVASQVLVTRAARRLGRPVAWVTSGSPVEVLLANGIVPFYPENHAAICAARGVGTELCEATEAERWSRDLCAYFRIDLGSQITGRTPLGRLVPPDLVVCCNNICGTVQGWFRATAERWGVPLLFLDAPFSEDAPTEGDVGYVREQLVGLAAEAARVARRRFDERALLAVVGRSMEALRLWAEVLETAAARPAPFTSFDAFVHMVPIVSLRGTRRAVWYYRRLLDELRARQRAGVAAIAPERARVVWDNIAIWPAHRALARAFRDAGVALVADTYTHAWTTTNLVADDPLTGLARAYTDIVLNHGAAHRTRTIAALVREYGASGFVLHSNRSCKRYSLGQYAVRRQVTAATGAAGVVVEADMADARCVSTEGLLSRLGPFFELLGAGAAA